MADNGFTVKVEGLSALVETMRQLPEAIEKGAVTDGVRSAAVMVRRALRKGPHPWTSRTGTLAKAIRYKKVRRKHATKGPRYLVGVWRVKAGTGGRYAGRRSGFYGRFLEDGTKTIPEGKYEWMRPVWLRIREQGYRVMIQTMNEKIEVHAGRVAARARNRFRGEHHRAGRVR